MTADRDKTVEENLLVGGGELGALVRSHDWSQTPLGAVESWSDDLKTAVQILLTELDRAAPPQKTHQDFHLLPDTTVSTAFCISLTDALSPLADPVEIQATASRLLGEYLGANRVAYFEVRGADYVVERDYANKVATIAGKYSIDSFGAKLLAAYRTGRPVCVSDVKGDPNLSPEQQSACAAIQIGAYIGIPLVKKGEFIAGLAVHTVASRDWTANEVALTQEVAERTWAAVERARAEVALRESEGRYHTLFESLDEGFCLLEVLFDAGEKSFDYRFVEFNEAFERHSGLVDAVGKTILELVPNLEPQWAECYGQVVKSGEAIRFEADVTSLNRVFDVYAFPHGAIGQNLVAVLFADITQRKRREANLAFLAEIQDDCARLTTADAMMQTVGAKIGTYLNLSVCAFVDIDEARDRAMVPYSWHRADAPNVTGTYRLSEFLSEAFHEDVRAGKVVVVNDTTADARTDAARHAALEIYSLISVPFLQDGELKFLLNVADARPRDWREDEIELFGELANRIFPRLERARAEAALRRSEERYRTLFNSIDEGFCVVEVMVDPDDTPIDYRILEINPVFEQQTGIPQAVGKTARELNLEEHWIEIYGRVALTGESVRLESGSEVLGRWFDVYACRTGDPQERKVAIVFKDISDRKLAEAIIATDLKNTRRLRDLSARSIVEDNIQVLYDEILATAIALTRADAGTVQILDQATQDLVMLASQGFDRAMTEHFYRVNASSKTSCGISLTGGTRAFVDFDVPECDDPDGSLRMHVNAGYLCAQSTPLRSRSGRPIGMVSTHWCKHHRPSDRELRFLDLLARQAADLIEQRQTEAERQQILQREQAARAEAERANRIKDEFLAVLSHELRSPLNPILGWTRLLQTGRLDANRQREALATIERNAKLQTQLIEDLLDISRIMQGKLSLTAAPVSLTFALSAAVETVRLAAQAKNIGIVMDFAFEVAPVSGDAARLQQVFWNLLANAVKFTPNDGKVIVELRQLDRSAQIRVIDTGKGINPQFIPHVFEYFRQEDGSTTRKFGGLGLGLAIVRQIVEMHGGTVQAQSQGENQGATFIVELPTMQRTPISSEPTIRTQTDAEMPLEGIEILLVDDEPDTRDFQAFLLEESGASVRAVASGLEALQSLEQFIPNVLVSDIGMAQMDGYMLLEQIRSLPSDRGGTIPAIALTSYAAEIDRHKAMQVGFQTHITKPVEPKELVRAIAILVDRKQKVER